MFGASWSVLLWQIKTIILSPETTTGFKAIPIIIQTNATERFCTMSVKYDKKERDMKDFWEPMLACMKWFHANNVCYHPKNWNKISYKLLRKHEDLYKHKFV